MKRILLIILSIFLVAGMTMPGLALAQDGKVILSVISKNPLGEKVGNIYFSIYLQEESFDGDKIIGNRVITGRTNVDGYASISWSSTEIKKYVIQFYQGNGADRVYTIYDQIFIPGREYNKNLELSGVRMVLKDGDGELLKNFRFDIYSVTDDFSGATVLSNRIFSNLMTGEDGKEDLYLKPGKYILRYVYPEVSKLSQTTRIFEVRQGNLNNYIEKIGGFKFAQKDANGNLVSNYRFNLYRKTDVFGTGEWSYLGGYSTGSQGYKILYLSDGDYRITFKDSNNNTHSDDFSVEDGSFYQLVNRNENFSLRILDVNKKPVVNRKVELYKDLVNDLKVYSGNTDTRGYVNISSMLSGNYYAVIDSQYRNAVYKSDLYYFTTDNDDDYDYQFQRYDYILSRARIKILNESNQILRQEVFTIFKYQTDSQGRTKAGEEIATLITNNSGYADIDLPQGKYLIKVKSKDGLYPISITAQKFNEINLKVGVYSFVSDTSSSYSQDNTDPTLISEENLYAKDTDGDGLSDFAEINIYNTSPLTRDTDGDGYDDKTEIRNNFDPNGRGTKYFTIFSYDKPRVMSLSLEQDLAERLKAELIRRMSRLNVSAENWHTVVNAYIYGEYTISEIVNNFTYGPGAVHPTIPAPIWRNR